MILLFLSNIFLTDSVMNGVETLVLIAPVYYHAVSQIELLAAADELPLPGGNLAVPGKADEA